MVLRRRTKKGHEVGNWFIVVKNKWNNLGTKDNRIARRRAAAFLRGEWPSSDAAEAAKVAKRAEQVSSADGGDGLTADARCATAHVPRQGRQPSLPPTEEPQSIASPAEAALPPKVQSLPAGEIPSPAGSADVEPEPDPAAEAAAAAGDVEAAAAAPVAPDEPVDLAVEMGKELQREFFAETGEEGDAGKTGAAILLGIEHAIGEKLAARAKPPRFLPELEADDFLFRVTACACRVLGRNLTGKIAIHPAWVLAGVLLVGYPVQLAFTAKTEEQLKAESGIREVAEGEKPARPEAA